MPCCDGCEVSDGHGTRTCHARVRPYGVSPHGWGTSHCFTQEARSVSAAPVLNPVIRSTLECRARVRAGGSFRIDGGLSPSCP